MKPFLTPSTAHRYTIIIYLVLLVFGTSPLARAAPICSKALENKENQELQPTQDPSPPRSEEHVLMAKQTYVNGRAYSGQILFLSAREYSEAVAANRIPVNSILVLDRLPLIDDLPLVAGLIISQPLQMGKTHVELLARKLGIVLTYLQGAYSNPLLREAAIWGQSFEIKCNRTACQLWVSEKPYAPRPRPDSVLPRAFDRSPMQLYTNLEDIPPRELSGDKFFNLALFKKAFPDLAPKIAALSSGYFEAFLNEYHVNGRSLRELRNELNKNLQEANAHRDEESVKSLLNDFTANIRTSRKALNPENLFSKISKTLIKYFLVVDSYYSIRSNNDAEDVVASGLYKSSSAKSLRPEDLEESLISTWLSLFDFRAYSIRRYLGQQEENLSMPILIHPYINDVSAHAVADFKMGTNDQLELHVTMVMGNESKATNPAPNAEKAEFIITKNPEGKLEFEESPGQPKLKIPQSIKSALKDFYQRVESYIAGEFSHRTIAPESINIELVLHKKQFLLPGLKVSVLQYKPTYSREITDSLLKGLISRQEIDAKADNQNNLETEFHRIFGRNAKSLQVGKLYWLEKLDRQQLKALRFSSPNTFDNIRYALVSRDGKPLIVVWVRLGHRAVKAKLRNLGLQWYKSGYAYFDSESDTPLEFSKTTLAFEVNGPDPQAPITESTAILKEALKNTLGMSGNFRDFVKALPSSQIKFETFEGEAMIDLAPYLQEDFQ